MRPKLGRFFAGTLISLISLLSSSDALARPDDEQPATAPRAYDASRILAESTLARAHRKELEAATRAFQQILSCVDLLGKRLVDHIGKAGGQEKRALVIRLGKLRDYARGAMAESKRRLAFGESERIHAVLVCADRIASALAPPEPTKAHDPTDALLAQMDADGCAPERAAVPPIEIPRGNLPSECGGSPSP